jgi:hypothetical protein
MGTLIRDVWLEYDVRRGGTNYMVIHCKFQVRAADTTSGRVRVAVYFYLSNGSIMPAGLPNLANYATPDGQAGTISENAKVKYNVTPWRDFRLYMPVAGLTPGQNCYGEVEIQDAKTRRPLATARTPTFDAQ